MEVGKEISQKIRSAIKAKLVDLGAYVDDELPDYIMVMVANKRTPEQMSTDLSLFLGANNAKFTSWLSHLLEKLQSIGGEDVLSGESTAASMTPQDVTKSTKKGSGSVAEKQVKAVRVEPVVEDTIKLTTDNLEEFDEDPPEQNMASSMTHRGSGAEKNKASAGRSDLPSQLRLNSHEDTVKMKSSDSVRAEASRRTMQEEHKSNQSDASRKRKIGSTVGAVLKHDVYEEEYDPHRPALGSVASVVRITDRKSSVPPSLQANKSLLLKAMKQAESSVEPAAKRLAVENVRQSSQHSSRGNERSKGGSRRRSPDPDRRKNRGQSKLTLKQRLGVHPTNSSSQDDSEQRRIELVSRSRRTEVAKRLGGPDTVKTEKKKDDITGDNEVLDEGDILDLTVADDLHLNQEDNQAGDRLEGAVPEILIQSGAEESDFTDGEGTVEDTRRFEVKSHNTHKRGASPKFVVTLDQVDPDLLGKDYNSDDEVDRLDLNGDMGSSMDQYDDSVEAGDTELMQNLGKPVSVNEGSPRTRGSVEEEVSFNFGSDEEDEEMFPDKAASVPDKCRFYPSCRNADSCPFYHPTEECRKFPNCRFGDKCLYIHPKCKFDGACTRVTCPFTHSARRPHGFQPPMPPTVIVHPIKVPVFSSSRPPRPPAPRPLHPSQITCKFFPSCTNMECPFDHPTPCRFGISCNHKATCKFLHPDLPSRSQLKWNSNSHPGHHSLASASQQFSPTFAT